MRKLRLTLVWMVTLGIAGQAGADANFVGMWIVKQEIRGQERESILTIKKDSGTWAGPRGTSDLAEVKIDDDTLTFTRTVSQRGEDFSSGHTATVIDDTLHVTMTSPQGDSDFTATRIPEAVRRAIEARESAIAALKRCDVLAVFAHPDDETFAAGTFAKLSANGERVQLIYTTSGDAGGDRTDQGLSGAALAAERENEMRASADVLEVSAQPLFLRYPDGFVYENWDKVVENVQAIIEKTQPKVVITFGPDGYYGHADHLAIGQITERAFDASGASSHLLHVAISRSRNDFIVKVGGGSRYKPVDDKFITYTVDVRKHSQQRVAAMEAHKTQFDDRTIGQYRMLVGLKGFDEFVEVRHPGQSGLLAELFAE